MDLFTGAHVQRTLGKWNGAYAAVMLRMWSHLKAQAVPLNAETWTEVTGLHSVPSELALLVESEQDKVLGQVAVHARFMTLLGLRAFVELGRRLYALSLTVPVSSQSLEAPAGQPFVETVRLATLHCHGDRALGVTMAYLVHVLPRINIHPAVGSLTPPPVTWSASGKAVMWEQVSTLADTPGPRAVWALLSNNHEYKLARLDAHDGVTEWDLPDMGASLGRLRWCVGVTPFKQVSKVVIVGELGAALLDVLQECEDDVRVVGVVRWDSTHAPSAAMTMTTVANFVCWTAGGGNLVALNLHTLSIELDADTLTLLADDILKNFAPAAQMHFIYRNGEVVACLPEDQQIVAVTGSARCMDVFTASHDWWRIFRMSDAFAHVVGLHLSAGFQVQHVSE